MKPVTSILALFILISTGKSFAQTYSFAGTPEITIAGTSNVHDWDEKVESINGNSLITWNTDGSFNITSLIIKIDCKSIKSSHGSIMDNKTYDALKAEKFPVITYKL